MSVFLVTWNPDVWEIADEYWAEQVRQIDAGRTYEEPWSIGNRTSGIHPGDTFLLVRVGRDRGIVASGLALSVAYKDLHFDAKRAKKKDLANYVHVEWNVQVPIENRLGTELLLEDFPQVPWNNLMGSGVKVADEVAERLVERWYQHVGINVSMLPEETASYVEGALVTALVNRYERNPGARKQCLQIYGTACSVCGFEGEKIYGNAGARLIHVHHLVELSEVNGEYEVDPRRDLRPVCPNCHAMIHKRRPAYSIEEVKEMLNKS
jgi:5-methylcytosine-specific restriction protein A